jgi:glycosyltransferase involved in cell wall biosynthesis
LEAPGVKRLLAISWSLPPLLGARALQVGRSLAALAARGWQVQAVSVAPRPTPPGVTLDEALAEHYLADVEVERVAAPLSFWLYTYLRPLLPGLAPTPDLQVGWARRAARRAERLLAGGAYDALITFGRPFSDHLAGRFLHARNRLPWLAHFSDPWADNPYDAAQSQKQQEASRRMEAQVVEEADALVFTNQPTLELVMGKYPAEWRIKAHVIPHGYDRALLPEPPAASDSRRLHLVHTGNFYGLRSPEKILEGLRILKERNADWAALELRFVGAVKHLDRWQAFMREHGLNEQVRFLPPMPYRDSLAAAGEADVLLVIDAPMEEASPFLPSKLVDYLMFHKPILGITPKEGASADLLRQLGQPIARPDDPEAIAIALAKLLAAWKRGPMKVSKKFEQAAEGYDIAVTTEQLEAILRRMVK